MMRLLATLALLAACSDGPSCDEVERHVTQVTAEADQATRASIDPRLEEAGLAGSQFIPQFGDYAKELGARCRDGRLAADGRRCFAAARSSSDIDRCANMHAR